MMVNEYAAEKLRELRKKLGLSQVKMAQLQTKKNPPVGG